MKKPIIHAYFLCYNEEYILPHVLKYYSKFCEKITIVDNMSTDSSVEIINSFDNTEVIPYNSNEKFDDLKHAQIKNTIWKQSIGEADYVIIGDIDEFLYHENMEEFLIKSFQDNITFFKPHGVHMIADEELELKPEDDIFELVKSGFPVDVMNKPMMFNCNKIREINYSLGAHVAKPTGEVNTYNGEDLKLLHYKYVGLKNHLKKCKPKGERLSDFNLKYDCGTYYLFSDEQNIDDYRHYLNRRVKILD